MALVYKIRRLREAKNYTQEYMSERLNISQNTYSKIETGGVKLTVDRLQQIADILEVPIDDVLAYDSNLNFTNNQVEKFYEHLEALQEDNRELIRKLLICYINRLYIYKKKTKNHLILLISL